MRGKFNERGQMNIEDRKSTTAFTSSTYSSAVRVAEIWLECIDSSFKIRGIVDLESPHKHCTIGEHLIFNPRSIQFKPFRNELERVIPSWGDYERRRRSLKERNVHLIEAKTQSFHCTVHNVGGTVLILVIWVIEGELLNQRY
mmetsp:Transcript_32923/g.55178  ORF Transcript_32923/g.55178 Transcript_32923/m.55178 type:complete len:143 (-) Transcript_32923:1680-2108(-)